MKNLSVILAMNYKTGDEHHQTAQLVRNGFAIGSKNFVNGQCVSSIEVDGLSVEDKCYFANEASDVCRLNLTVKLQMPAGVWTFAANRRQLT